MVTGVTKIFPRLFKIDQYFSSHNKVSEVLLSTHMTWIGHLISGIINAPFFFREMSKTLDSSQSRFEQKNLIISLKLYVIPN